MIHFCEISNPKQLWINHKESMPEDFFHHQCQISSGIQPEYTDFMLNLAIISIENKILSLATIFNRELVRELNYNHDEMLMIVEDQMPLLPVDQAIDYEKILQMIQKKDGEMIFLDSPGGTGMSNCTASSIMQGFS